MKAKFILMAITAAMLSACAPKGEAAEAAAEQTATEQTVEAAAPEAGKLVVLEDDNLYRPGHKAQALTILDFGATWCPPCRQFAPVFDAAAEKYADVVFVSIDVDRNPATAEAFGVRAIPTVVFLNSNGEIARFVGTEDLLPAEKFHQLVETSK